MLDITEYLNLKPYLGIGANTWLRRLDDTGGRVYGYDETWLTLYPLLGLRAGVPVTRRLELFGRTELRLAAYNVEKVDLSNLGGPSAVYLYPGRQLTVGAEAGLNIAFVFIAFFYESLRFGESDVDSQFNIFQPESRADVFGLRVGAVF